MLSIQNVSYNAINNSTEKEILDNISIDFQEGKNYIITGANGSGKSTLAKIIMGILSPTSGKIIWNGQDITTLDITCRAKLGIAFAFQQPVRFKGLTARDLLQTAGERNFATSTACEYLSQVGLCARDYLDRELDNTLSGGELKRIEIASVLARNSMLNIFDEPEAGIDIWSFGNLVNLFQKPKNNSTNIIISHQERLFDIANNIILIDNGKIIANGSKADILPLLRKPLSCRKIKDGA